MKIINEPKPFRWPDTIPPIEGGNYKVFSQTLKDIPAMLKAADEADVSGLREFLFENPEKPLLIIGNGGAHEYYTEMLYQMNCGVAKSVTPLELAAMSDETIKNSKCLMMSSSGANMDAKYAIGRLLKLNPENTAGLVQNACKGSGYDKFDGTAARKFVFLPPHSTQPGKAFVNATGKFFRDGVVYRAFSGKKVGDITVSLQSEDCYRYQLNNSDAAITPMKDIQHLYALYNGYSMPAAMDLESLFAESGTVSVQLTDYRNYCHGRFMFAANHTRHHKRAHTLEESDVAMVLYVTPRDKDLVRSVRELGIATQTPIVLIETPYNDARASIDLLVKTTVFIADLQEKARGANPCNPNNFNAQDIDKRFPENAVRFEAELKKNGSLVY